MATTTPIPIASAPGINRDATNFESPNFIDGLWVRWNARSLPCKMAGYSAETSNLPEKVYGINSYVFGPTNYVYMGSESFLTQFQTDLNGNPGAQNDRTPAGFIVNPANVWQMDYLPLNATVIDLIAHAGQNLTNIGNVIETPIYLGQVNLNTPLTDTTGLATVSMPNVAGGIFCISPYLIGYSIGGRVDVSTPNLVPSTGPPTSVLGGSAFVTDQKIIKGLPLRNGSGGPAGLLWSLDQLLIMTFNAAITTGVPFNFNTISDDISVLSSQSILEFDGIYYWPGVDRFQLYNGVVQELPNNMCLDFFYNNVNFTQRQKVFAFKVPRWGEIWWCFPTGTNVDCNHAVIYNTRLKCWYDTPLPDAGRTAGLFPKVFQRPFMCDNTETASGYTLWQHEYGLDKIINSQTLPITSYFQTAEVSPIKASQPQNKAFRVDVTEPDFIQTGPLEFSVFGRANARDTFTESNVVTFSDQNGGPPSDQVVLQKFNARLMSFKFQSNSVGGNYSMGKPLVHVEPTDGRYTR
jgi:hypothetical protein